MEHHLLAPLHSLILKERPCDPDELSAANLVALRLLTGPYLGTTYESWGVVRVEEGHWCLCQDWRGEIFNRDVFEPFYPDFLSDEPSVEKESGSPDRYLVNPPRKLPRLDGLPRGEEHMPQAIRRHADAMMDRLLSLSPRLVSKLLKPTPEQMEQRYDIVIEEFLGKDLSSRVRSVIGNHGDWSLGAYGIDYHYPSFSSSEQVFFLAHNGQEVCGLLKLTPRDWAYGVAFVSVSPGFRGRGLSLNLYKSAIDKCMAEQKVLLRSDPGDDTPPQATIAYDRLLKESRVLHSASHGSLSFPLQLAFQKGWPYDRLVGDLKMACDDALPSPRQRLGRRLGALDVAARDEIQNHHAAVFDCLIKGNPEASDSRPRLKP